MKISKNGIKLITSSEGCRLKAYKAVPTEKLYTIGYGHYGVQANTKISKAKAEELLVSDLEKFEAKVQRYNGIYNFNQNQFDALVSFAYNVGSIEQLTQNGTRTIEEISFAIPRYCFSGGKKLRGLVKRRTAERKLFDTKCKNPIAVIALEVINGEWGTGEERKAKLKASGYNYKEVQAEVNKLLK